MTAPRILVIEHDLTEAERLTSELVRLGMSVCGVVPSARDIEALDADLVVTGPGFDPQVSATVQPGDLVGRLGLPVVSVWPSGNRRIGPVSDGGGLGSSYACLSQPITATGLYEAIEIASYKCQLDRQLRAAQENCRIISELASDAGYVLKVGADGSLVPDWVTGVPDFFPNRLQEPGPNQVPWLDMVHPDDQETLTHQLEVLLSGRVAEFDIRLVLGNGKIRWLRLKNRPVFDPAEGRVVRIIGAVSDVTEHKEAEQEVIQYRAQLQEMVAQRTAELAQANERLRHEVVERMQAEQALQLRNRELTLLQQSSRVFGSSLDVNRVLSTVLEEVRNLLAVDACSIWLVEPGTGELIRRQGAGLKDDMLRGWRLPPGQGLAGWAASRRESLVVHDATADERHFTGVDEFTGVEMRSILCVPLQIKDSVIGVIQILDKTAGRFEAKDLELVEALAAPAAIAIENARLYGETSELRVFNETIVQSMEEGIVLLDQTDTITFANPKTTELLGFSQDQLVGMRWRSLIPQGRRIRHGNGTATRYETELGTSDGSRLPVIVSARPLFEGSAQAGSLAVFTDISDLKAAERALRQNMELLEQRVRDRTRELSVLYRVTAIASESLDLSAGLARSLEEMLSAVDSSAGAIHLLDETDENLTLAAQRGLAADLCAELECAPVSTSQPGLAIIRREPVVIQEPAGPDGQRLPSYLGVPIRAGGRMIGVLSIYGRHEQRLTAEEIALLSSAADHIGVAVENARLRRRAEHAAAMEERERLAKDLHDSVTQSLYSLTLFTKVALELTRRGDLSRLEHNLMDATASAQQALKEMRLLVHQLRPLVLRQEGLPGALRQRLDAVEKRSGVDGRLEVDGMQELPEATEVGLYLIGLEALNNALKHARAAAVVVRLSFAPGAVRLEVQDDGQGFNLEAASQSGGMGLTNMTERAAKLGGSLDILTAPGAGTRVAVKVPLRQAAAGTLPDDMSDRS